MDHHRNHSHLLFSTFYRHKWNPEVLEFYIYKVFRNIGFSLLSVFVPIFLYADVGYSLFQILLFFIINQVFFLVFIPFSGKIIEKIGVKHSIFLHLPAMALFAYGLRFLGGNFYQDLMIICIILAIRAIPKVPMHTAEIIFISKNLVNHKGSEGKSLALIRMTLILASLLSPLVGGMVSYFFGFEAFFNVAIGIILFAMVPLLLTKDQYFKIKENSFEILNFTFRKLPRNFHLAEAGRWMSDSVVWVLLPLFIYIVVQTTLSLGFVIFLSGLISLLVSYYVGKRIDTKSPKILLRKMTKIGTSIFFLRTLFPTPSMIVLTDALNNITNPILMLPYEKYFYDYVKSIKNIVEISIASTMILEFYYTLSFIFLTIIFGTLEFIGIETTYWIFLPIFFVYGFLILLMNKISSILE